LLPAIYFTVVFIHRPYYLSLGWTVILLFFLVRLKLI
jgi:hypothetical protein